MIPTPPKDRDFPWWLVARCGDRRLYLFWQVLTDDLYAQVLSTLSRGIWVTVFVTLVAFSLACAAGAGAGAGGAVAVRCPAADGAVLHRGRARHADHRAVALRGLRAGARDGGGWNWIAEPHRAGPDPHARFFAAVAGDHRADHRLFRRFSPRCFAPGCNRWIRARSKRRRRWA